MSNVGLGKQRADVYLLRQSSESRFAKMVHQNTPDTPSSQPHMAFPNQLLGRRSLCGCRPARLRNSAQRWAPAWRMSTSPANGEAKRWNIAAIPLDELNLLTLSFEAGGTFSFEDPFIRWCRSDNRYRLR